MQASVLQHQTPDDDLDTYEDDAATDPGDFGSRLTNPHLAETAYDWEILQRSLVFWNPSASLRSREPRLPVLVLPDRLRAKTPASVENEVALEQLAEVDREAEAEGLPPICDAQKVRACLIASSLSERFPVDIDMYPTDDRELAIDIQGRPGCGILILLDPTGGATCFVTRDGENRRAKYSNAGRLPDAFLGEALAEMVAPG